MPIHNRLYHLSDLPKLKIIEPYAAYGELTNIDKDVVIAYTNDLLPHYLLPPKCPRITVYKNDFSSTQDIEHYLGHSSTNYFIAIESGWYQAIQRATVFCYEVNGSHFSAYDECKGIYIADAIIKPLKVRPVYNILEELVKRNVEIRFIPSLDKMYSMLDTSTLSVVHYGVKSLSAAEGSAPGKFHNSNGYPNY